METLVIRAHHFFRALLAEMQASLACQDWAHARSCLLEFHALIECHSQTESEVLCPRLAALSPDTETPLTEPCQEYTEIALLVESTLKCIDKRMLKEASQLCSQLKARVCDLLIAQKEKINALGDLRESPLLAEYAKRTSQSIDMTSTP